MSAKTQQHIASETREESCQTGEHEFSEGKKKRKKQQHAFFGNHLTGERCQIGKSELLEKQCLYLPYCTNAHSNKILSPSSYLLSFLCAHINRDVYRVRGALEFPPLA